MCTLLILATDTHFCFAQPAPVNLDLSSTTRTINQGSPSAAGTINIGGVAQSVSSSDSLTPAERAALIQVVQTGQQSIIIGVNGNAIGGHVDLTMLAGDTISQMVIPAGMTASHNFGIAPSLDILGNLVNAGHLYAYSSLAQQTTASISADNIVNQQNAVISSVIPAASSCGIL